MLSKPRIQRLYDRLASVYAWFSIFEGKAKSLALASLHVTLGSSVLEVGLGTGEQLHAISQLTGEHGMVVGMDISRRMLQKARNLSINNLCQGDGENLPFSAASFERLYCAYVLDLLPFSMISQWLLGFRRILKPGGRLVLVCLTEGVNPASRVIVGIWKALYKISPSLCAGCRPLLLSRLASLAGFKVVERKVVVQLGLPSEVLALQVD